MSASRTIALLSAAFVGGGCKAGWNALVRYSPEPAIHGEGVEDAVYATVLADYFRGSRIVQIGVEDSMPRGHLLAVTSVGAGIVRPHWADTLKSEVSAALADSGLQQPAPTEALRRAVERFAGGVSDSAGPPRRTDPPANAYAMHVWMTRPGFNRDSTLAAIYVTYWCGMLCAGGETILLARRPGYRWQIWHRQLHWIS